MNTSLNSISINDVKHIQGGSYIDDDLILMENMSNMPITLEPRRMDFIRHGLEAFHAVWICALVWLVSR